MEKFQLQSSEGVDYTVRLPAATPTLISCYFFAFAKSGSTLVDNMLADYCSGCECSYFSLFGQAFSQGITTSHVQSDALKCFHRSGYIYSGFRHYPAFELPVDNAPVVLLVRDPRDMLVSLYFSIAKSHVIPTPGSRLVKERERVLAQDLQQFVVRRAPGYAKQLNQYLQALARADLLEMRYEDGIYKKKEMLGSILEHYNMTAKPRLIKKIAGSHDIIPDRENEKAHVRQVHPGNFRERLKPETIDSVNEILAPFLERYGYPRS